jgi:SAM-dependent methyltransferase
MPGRPRNPSQAANAAWWREHPMTYEGYRADQPVPHPAGSAEWFDAIDERFHRAAFTAHDGGPFGRYLPAGSVDGVDVLEIGCGMGTHSELLARAGARLTAVDITPEAVAMTRRRLQLRQLPGDVREADAERLPFDDASFDLVWTWGVLHHSSSFERCLAEVDRVLRPGGRLFMMVYHRTSAIYYLHNVLIRGLVLGQRRHRSFADIYDANMDGAYARMFTRKEMAALLAPGYARARIEISGQKAELLPVPASPLKQAVEERVPDAVARQLLRRWGFFLVVDAIRR